MAKIELRGVAHRYGPPGGGGAHALKPLDLAWEAGGAYALLGPSGCGKTTLLNVMSGLLAPTEGSVWFDGVDVTAAPPEVRNIAQVFQFPVLYDTMTVFENLAFPLRNRGVGWAEARARVEQIAELLELTADLGRKASRLTADRQQRISLGRGLVRRDVAAILLDEPLTVIDPHEKWRLRRKLRQVHAELGVTLVYVTHDQVEALTLADEVVVMNEGRVLQRGSPQDLFERPAHAFVGHFIGSPGMNLLPCALAGDDALVEGQRVALPPGVSARARAAGGELLLGIRPEHLARRAPAPGGEGGPPADGAPKAVVTAVEALGPYALVSARLGRCPVKFKLDESEAPPAPGDECWLEFPPRFTTLYADGRAVA
ncbi:MAG TPA: ABC transporter ATP-binding protein [Polyangiaceae bacterium]|nr:ABC transporter ATP-binding protein [Polyangiaceae bacterium]